MLTSLCHRLSLLLQWLSNYKRIVCVVSACRFQSDTKVYASYKSSIFLHEKQMVSCFHSESERGNVFEHLNKCKNYISKIIFCGNANFLTIFQCSFLCQRDFLIGSLSRLASKLKRFWYYIQLQAPCCFLFFLQCWCPRLLDIKGHVAIMKEPISSTPTTGSRHWVLWLNQHLYIKVEASTIFDILVKLQLGFVLQGVRSTCNNFDKFK